MALPTFEEEIALGTTRKLQFQLQDEDTEVAQPLSGFTKIWLTGKLDVNDDDDDAILKLYWPGGGGTTLDIPTGITEWKITAAMTNALPLKVYDLITDLKGLDSAGDTWWLNRGLITLTPEVHQGVS